MCSINRMSAWRLAILLSAASLFVSGCGGGSTKATSTAAAQGCDELGINAQKLKEGECINDNGRRIKVSNRGTQLELEEMAVKVDDIDTRDINEGGFKNVYVTVTVKNKTGAPAEVFTSQFELNPDADSNYTASIANTERWRDAPLKPDESDAYDLRFFLKVADVPKIDVTGNLNIVQFTDAHATSYDDVEKTIGIIRTYH